MRFFAGVTLAQPPGAGAVCVVRRRKIYEWLGNPRRPRRHFTGADYRVGHLERLPPGLTYPRIIERIGEVLKQPVYSDKVEIAVNITEVGKPFLELCRSARLQAKGITITTGDAEVYEEHSVRRIPQATLIAQIQTLLHDEKLTVSTHLANAEDLIRELGLLRLHRTDAGRARFEVLDRRGDLAAALSMAIWSALNWHETIVTELRI